MLLRLIIEMLVLMIKNTGTACIAIPIQVSVFMTIQLRTYKSKLTNFITEIKIIFYKFPASFFVL